MSRKNMMQARSTGIRKPQEKGCESRSYGAESHATPSMGVMYSQKTYYHVPVPYCVLLNFAGSSLILISYFYPRLIIYFVLNTPPGIEEPSEHHLPVDPRYWVYR